MIIMHQRKDETQVEAAVPILASTLCRQQLPAYSTSPTKLVPKDSPIDSQPSHLSTSLHSLDTSVLLSGGFAYGGATPGSRPGEIVSIAFEGGARSITASTFSHALLAAHLIPLHQPSPSASAPVPALDEQTPRRAFYIDATGDFSPRMLYDQVLQRLRLREQAAAGGPGFKHQGGYVYSRAEHARDDTAAAKEEVLQQRARDILEQVSYMRVLDLVGIMEAVGDIQDDLFRSGKAASETSDRIDVASVAPQSQDSPIATRFATVADSQADSDADEDMLDWPASPQREPTPEQPSMEQSAAPQPTTQIPARSPPLVLLPSIPTHLTTPMRVDQVRTHALVAHLMRSLRALCHSPTGACVVLTNSTVSATANSTSEELDTGANSRRRAGRSAEDGPSAFADKARLRPTLGSTFAQLVDLSIMATYWKKEKGAWVAEVLGDSRGARIMSSRNEQDGLEVKYVSRIGRWCMFGVADGQLKDMGG